MDVKKEELDVKTTLSILKKAVKEERKISAGLKKENAALLDQLKTNETINNEIVTFIIAKSRMTKMQSLRMNWSK